MEQSGTPHIDRRPDVFKAYVRCARSATFYTTNFNPLSTNPTKWSNILKQFVSKELDHFLRLALKGLSTFHTLFLFPMLTFNK